MAMISIGHEYAAAVEATRARLGVSGTWFDADEVRAIVARADARSRQRSSAPWHHELPDSTEILRLSARAVIDRIASDPGSVDAGWAAEQIGDLGEGPYVELVGTTAVAVALRLFADAVGVGVVPVVTAAEPGEPSRDTPDGLGDIGAYVKMLEPFPFANVARALSQVPTANATFYTLVRPMYSAAGFDELVWKTPLSRPQVELVAARVAAMNECFY
jgi:hypothetical protein